MIEGYVGYSGQLSSSDEEEHGLDQSKLGMLSSEEDSEDEFDVANPVQLVQLWELGWQAADIPVLLVPEPIAFLISRKQWTGLLLRASWHDKCVDKQANPLSTLPGMAFPTDEHLVWKARRNLFLLSCKPTCVARLGTPPSPLTATASE